MMQISNSRRYCFGKYHITTPPMRPKYRINRLGLNDATQQLNLAVAAGNGQTLITIVRVKQ